MRFGPLAIIGALFGMGGSRRREVVHTPPSPSFSKPVQSIPHSRKRISTPAERAQREHERQRQREIVGPQGPKRARQMCKVMNRWPVGTVLFR